MASTPRILPPSGPLPSITGPSGNLPSITPPDFTQYVQVTPGSPMYKIVEGHIGNCDPAYIQDLVRKEVDRMMKDEQFMQKLLRIKDLDKLPPDARPAIKGSLGEAKHGEDTGFPEPDQSILEHGVLIPLAAGPTFPLEVHTTAYLDQYFLGPGTPIPDQGVNQFLVSEAVRTDSTCNPDQYVYSWPNSGIPFVTMYDSILYVDSAAWQVFLANQHVNLWSGLGLLLAQVCVGTKKSVSSVVSGVGWAADPNTDGVVRFWDPVALSYRYWYTKNTAAEGLQAVELVPTKDGSCPLEWLNADKQSLIVLSQHDKQVMEAWVMRTLNAQGAVTTLLTPAELSKVWDNGADAVAYGWCHSFQQLGENGEDEAKSAIVTLWEEVVDRDTDDNPLSTHHNGACYRITYDFSAGNLTASLFTVQSGTMHIENTVIALWKPRTGGGLTLYYSQLNDPGQNDASIPVYCFFDYDGSLLILEYEKHFAETSGEQTNYVWEDTEHCIDRVRGWLGLCTNETASIYRKDERSRRAAGGGWKIGSVDATRRVGTNGGTALETKTAEPPTTGSELECCMDSWGNHQPNYIDLFDSNEFWCGGDAWAWFDGICPANAYACRQTEMFSRPGDATRLTRSIDYYGGGSSHAKGAIIPRNQRNGVYVCQAIYRKDIYRQTGEKVSGFVGTPDCPNDPFCGGGTANFAEFKVTFEIEQDQGDPPTTHTSPWFSNGWTSCNYRDDGCGLTIPWTFVGEENIDEYDMQAWLVSANGVKTLSNVWEDWIAYCGGSQGDPDRGWNSSFVLTYYDTMVWWYDAPNDFYTGSFPHSPSTHVYVPAGFV